ncbi:ABC transporter ATP-binding protein [Anaeroselena agilis]|uniref:Dipeptide/oligopeptide/nickel ABC transporter ATP-binding protein n=1 Tax=Anaeroselena agilis TaxID=3063788 RepID=A0ABU3P245_9FIRM|nr:dipeptide/oligopeptide/nickel ABC transporter ATP-binding protein [Selenomonadales bacterium 4137-cl]
MTEPIIRITEVTKSFPRHHQPPHIVLNRVSFAVGAGEIIGLIGESGSGKSTLARIIAGLTAPDGGAVDWPGDRDDGGLRAQMIFQNPYASLYRGMTVRELVAEPLVIQNKKAADRGEAVRQALRQVVLPDDDGFLGRYPQQLSGGQRQRVAIARALAGRPRLLVADEPTSMLDVPVQKEITDLLLALNRQTRLSILFITHDLALAAYACSRLVVLAQGKVAEEGETAAVVSRPRSPETAGLLENARRLHDGCLRLLTDVTASHP